VKTRKSVLIIAAVAKNGVIGKNGAVPWYNKEDMHIFKCLTLNHSVIMGRNTWNSLPEKHRPLADRENIVVASKPIHGVLCAQSLAQALELARSKEVFVIGGERLYAEALPLADRMYISHMQREYVGDTYFPEVNYDGWSEFMNVPHLLGKHPFTFKAYARKCWTSILLH